MLPRYHYIITTYRGEVTRLTLLQTTNILLNTQHFLLLFWNIPSCPSLLEAPEAPGKELKTRVYLVFNSWLILTITILMVATATNKQEY